MALDLALSNNVPLGLRICEIFSNIVDQAYSGGENGATVAALGQTCRAFFRPAMEVLWRDLEGIEYLIMTLPSDLWRAPRVGAGKRKLLTFMRALAPEDWSRFDMYANWVRGLRDARNSPLNPYVELGRKVWTSLAEARENAPMLPRLRVLLCPLRNVPLLCYPVLSSSAALPTVRFELWRLRGRYDITALMRLFAVGSSHVENLEVFGGGERPLGDVGVKEALVALVQHSPRLRTFKCSSEYVSQPVYAHLASSGKLVEFAILGQQHGLLDNRVLPAASFSALAVLKLPAAHLSWATSLLSHISASPLRVIEIRPSVIAGPAELHKFLHAVSRFRSTLRHFVVEELHERDEYDDAALDAAFAAPIASLRPLQALVDLVEVKLDVMMGLGLTDQCVEEIATWWPRMENLFLRNVVTPAFTITLHGLAPLVARYRHLQLLTLTVVAGPPGFDDRGERLLQARDPEGTVLTEAKLVLGGLLSQLWKLARVHAPEPRADGSSEYLYHIHLAFGSSKHGVEV